jgi:hypothetical protein
LRISKKKEDQLLTQKNKRILVVGIIATLTGLLKIYKKGIIHFKTRRKWNVRSLDNGQQFAIFHVLDEKNDGYFCRYGLRQRLGNA